MKLWSFSGKASTIPDFEPHVGIAVKVGRTRIVTTVIIPGGNAKEATIQAGELRIRVTRSTL